jgi:hypothetical protein
MTADTAKERPLSNSREKERKMTEDRKNWPREEIIARLENECTDEYILAMHGVARDPDCIFIEGAEQDEICALCKEMAEEGVILDRGEGPRYTVPNWSELVIAALG